MSCNDKNPLTREGTSLINRVLAALSTTYAKVDERDTASLLLFAKGYGTCLNYFNNNSDIPESDWEALMRMDMSVVLATLMKINVGEISDYKKLLYKRIRLAGGDADAERDFKFLFDCLFSLITLIDRQYDLLNDDLEFKSILKDVITKKLKLPAGNLVKCFGDFKAANLLDYTLTELDNDAPLPVTSDKDFSIAGLTAGWQPPPAPDLVLTLPGLAGARSNILYIINHNLFNAQIESLLNGVSSVISRAEDLFNQTLADFPTHTPHYALFLAFINLFRYAQDELNQYTKHHLDYYYKEVLQLSNSLPEGDSVHLLFELQKQTDECLLTKNTLFKGGKDIAGKDINYFLPDDIVLNKTVIAGMHSMQIVHGSKDIVQAAVLPGSDDGLNPKLTSTDKSWFTFGDPGKVAAAKAGFAIASNLLFLNEGRRTITVTVSFADDLPDLSSYALNCFNARLTGKKDWLDLTRIPVSSAPNTLQFMISLTPNHPAIIPYTESIHKEQRPITLPVLEIYLDQDTPSSIPYTLLCSRLIDTVVVSVDVKGVKDLVLSNNSGAIDASKPFSPFGNFPVDGSAFYIGSKEIFQKDLTQMELHLEYKDPPIAFNIYPTASYLREGAWEDSFDITTTATSGTISFLAGEPFTRAAIDFSRNEKLASTTLEGFLQINLNSNDYSLDAHLKDISAKLSAGTSLTLDTSSSPIKYNIAIAATPVAPEIILNTFSVDYTAQTTISFDPSRVNDVNHLFFLLAPFGYYRVNEAWGDPTMLPDIAHDGELFIGFSGGQAGTVVNVLFQVADGSSNPLKDMETLGWYYLAANNSWKPFDDRSVVDGTNNFTQSGILTFTFPGDIDNTNTLLATGLHWIKATVSQNTDAVCKMILVQAQAALVRLQQDFDKQVEFRQTLPAGSISKLVISNAGIKAITQPFDSFDGRTRETDDHFYVRVSERLRHKQRAITIWDYEHIILEKFQQVFKVKCINHSGFYTEQNSEVFCENYPGHVTVITIPDLRHRLNVNPLQPNTPIGVINNISSYLGTITSPFVKLHVKNPQFEEIRLDFKVKFYDHLNEPFYLNLLNIEIERFLCPWAYDDNSEISFDETIVRSELLNFVEKRPYVDFVTCFKMDQIIRRKDNVILDWLPDIEVAKGSTARSVLVSYFDVKNNVRHHIVSPATCDC